MSTYNKCKVKIIIIFHSIHIRIRATDDISFICKIRIQLLCAVITQYEFDWKIFITYQKPYGFHLEADSMEVNGIIG